MSSTRRRGPQYWMGVMNLAVAFPFVLFVLRLWSLRVTGGFYPHGAPPAPGQSIWGVLVWTPLPIPWIVVGVAAIRNRVWACWAGLLLILPTVWMTLFAGWIPYLLD